MTARLLNAAGAFVLAMALAMVARVALETLAYWSVN